MIRSDVIHLCSIHTRERAEGALGLLLRVSVVQKTQQHAEPARARPESPQCAHATHPGGLCGGWGSAFGWGGRTERPCPPPAATLRHDGSHSRSAASGQSGASRALHGRDRFFPIFPGPAPRAATAPYVSVTSPALKVLLLAPRGMFGMLRAQQIFSDFFPIFSTSSFL